MGLESISEPDDMDMDEPQEDGIDEPFFDTPHDARSPSTSPDTSVKGGTKSSDFDTEEDPMGPITPGPTSRTTFDTGKGDSAGIHGRVDEFDDEDEEEDDDDDDDWVDPSIPSPSEKPPAQLQAPVMTPSKSNGSTSSGGSETHGKNKSKKSKKSLAVPITRTPEPSAHFPFPSSVEDTPQPQQRDSSPDNWENGAKQHRMHTARARDGGRTQSGGVKGVLTTDDGENS